MSVHRRVRRKPMAQINVVPYIDVMLVLLVIFMVTTPMMQQGVDVELPQVDSKPVQNDSEEQQIVVAVNANGEFYVDEDGRDARPVDVVGLANRVAELLQKRQEKKVYVRADKAVDYGHVMEAMAALQAAGAGHIGLLAEPPVKR
ncbi:MAG TPA: protein TolR [Gammaproteobacteria bacterium]|nr:protein TolR [Gammaproteobacteria bacterium]